MINFTDLTDVFGLFGFGLAIGVALITLFFIIGSMIAYVYSLMTHA